MDQETIDALKLDGGGVKPKETERIRLLGDQICKTTRKLWGEYMNAETRQESMCFADRVVWTRANELSMIYDKFDPEEAPAPAAENGVNQKLCFEECGVRWYSSVVVRECGLPRFTNNGDRDIVNFYQSLIGKYGEKLHELFFGTLEDKQLEEKILNEFNHEIALDLFGDSYQGIYGNDEKYTPDTYGVTFPDKGLIVMKPAVRVWNDVVKSGEKEIPKDNRERRKMRSLWINAANNNFLAHELMHMFHGSGHRDRSVPAEGSDYSK